MHFSIRRRVLLEVGAFDEYFEIYGNENVELALRFRNAGVELVYCPEAVARQHYEKDFPALARDNVEKGRTAVLCARKHPEAFSRLKLALLLWLGRAVPSAPERALRLVTWLERRRPAGLGAYYSLALDYFYWGGPRPVSSSSHETPHRLLHR